MSDYFKDRETSEYKGRVFITTVFVAVAFFALIVRLWYLQVKEGDYYRKLAESNRIRTVKSPAPRGIISDRNGIKLADNRPGFDLYLVSEDVTDWHGTKETLERLIGIAPLTIDEKLERSKNRPPFQAVKLKEDLAWEEAVKIETFKHEMPGVMLEVTPKRNYIFGEAMAHLIGYLGEISEKELKDVKGGNLSPGDLIGKFGMERSFENELSGVDGAKELEVDALGRKMRVVNQASAYPGSDIKLTIDARAQMAAWAALKDKAGAAVAIEPSTGRVLAMVSAPSFDPNILSSRISNDEWNKLVENPLDVLSNRAIQGQYPPASTFKPIHAAAALEEKVITPATRIYSGPSFRFGNRDFRDWKEEGHGVINVHRAIVESSDTFFYQVGLKLGVDRLARYAKGFGFGSKTGISLSNEKSGIVPSSEWKKKAYGVRWYEGETVSVSVGHGYMLSTPLQLANAYAAIANNGTLYVPQVIDSITTPMGTMVKGFMPIKRSELNVSKDTLAYVRKALEGVVQEAGGTAGFLKASGLDIAGKTGTAQVSKLIRRTKDVKSIAYKFRDHAWFAGYAPYGDPKIAVAVIVEHGGFGASAAAPIAREIIRAYLGGAGYGVKEDGAAPAAITASAEGGAAVKEEDLAHD